MNTTFSYLQQASVNISGVASGFWITEHWVVSAGHVVGQVQQHQTDLVGYVHRDGKQVANPLTLVKSFMPDYDIAIFAAQEPHPGKVVPLASVYRDGQDLYGFGYQPYEEKGRFYMLKHQGRTVHGNADMLVLDGHIFHGFSGSLLYNPVTDAICGMVTSVRKHQEQVLETYAISSVTLERCIRQILPSFETKPIDTMGLQSLDDTGATPSSIDLSQGGAALLAQAEAHLRQSDFENVFDILRELAPIQSIKNDLILTESKYHNLRRNQNLGMASYEQMRIEQSQIGQALLLTMENIREWETEQHAD